MCEGHLRFSRGRAELTSCASVPEGCAFDSDGNHIGDFCGAHLFDGIHLNLDPTILPGMDDATPEAVTVRPYRAFDHPVP